MAGTGKTYTLTQTLKKYKTEHPNFVYDGPSKASQTTLYATAFKCMRESGIVVFDDCDSAFNNEDASNILKHMTDTTSDRYVD